MSRVRGKVCAVTGAGSGIGRAIAIELGDRGARGISISDVNEGGLVETEAMIDGGVTEVHRARLDVSDRDAVGAYAADVADRFGSVNQVFNNAGIADSGCVDEFDYERYERVIGVNLWGVIYGTKEFLPYLIASGDGHITNVSSINGIMAQTRMSAYCASKFAVRGFSESVALDLRNRGLPVKVTVAHPGGVKTAIATAALEYGEASGHEVTEADRLREKRYNKRLLRMDPRKAARIVVDGVEANRPRVMVGGDAKLMDRLVRAAPRRWPVAGRLIDRVIEA